MGILKNSAIYSLLNLLQKGVNFILIPVLTVYLTTFDYGIIAVITVINSFLNVLYLFSLNGSLNRFYYEFKDDEETIKRLFGSVVTFVFLLSFFCTILLLAFHEYLIDPFLEDIEFYPYMILGLISILFNPIFAIYQDTLIAKQQAGKYSVNSFLFFLTNICLLLIGVILLDLGAKGVLGALAITNLVFFLYTITRFRKEIKLGIDFKLLKKTLNYSLPLVPHSVAGVATSVIDKIIINKLISTSMVGIYHIGNTFGGVIFIIASSVNRAFVPWFNQQIKDEIFDEIPKKALALITAYSCIALLLSLFGKELISVFTPQDYHKSWEVIPFISFAFVFHGIYYFYSIPLFYDITGRGNRVLPVVTIAGALINITLNFILIPEYGIVGASIATLVAKVILILVLRFVYPKFLKINYYNTEMILLVTLMFFLSLISFSNFDNLPELAIKVVIYFTVLLLILYRHKRLILIFLKTR